MPSSSLVVFCPALYTYKSLDLEKWLRFFSLNLEKGNFMSLSPLDYQDFDFTFWCKHKSCSEYCNNMNHRFDWSSNQCGWFGIGIAVLFIGIWIGIAVLITWTTNSLEAAILDFDGINWRAAHWFDPLQRIRRNPITKKQKTTITTTFLC